MRILQSVTGAIVLLAVSIAAASAQPAVPEHRYVYAQDTDFFGADLAQMFDTTRSACARACSAQRDCVAFTFNTRSNACFPKSGVTQTEFFEGALSARKQTTPADIHALAAVRLAELGFQNEADIALAVALVQTNADRYMLGGITLEDAVAALDAAVTRGDIPAAARWAGSAVALTDRGYVWARLAWLGLRPRGDTPRDLHRRLQREAVPAAINAYLRAQSVAQQVTALDLLSRALEANRRGREMIAPLRLAAGLEPREEIQARLDTAIGKYGFRITDTRVDNNAARPRICAEFSEKLVQAGVDYQPFVRLTDPALVVEAGAQELCIDGVSHGARYTATFRAGLPAASGEVLHNDIAVTLYVRDRDPSVRFSGRAYVLPRSAQAALPVETVNTDTVELTLRRVSDRNLLRAMQDSYFGKPLSKYEEDAFSSTIAQDVWSGSGEVKNTLNVTMTTRLPLDEALAGEPAGIYALTAGIKGADPYENPAATQWFILTDLGLATVTGVDGLHATVRSLRDAKPRAGVSLSLISQANAVLGEVETDDQGRAHFPAGLTRGNGAAAPALLMAVGAGGDAAFLSLREPAFDLSDRGVEGRAPAPAIDTYLSTDRGAYRAGETIFATVLTRDAQGRAVNGLPLVAVLRRPDGVEYSRTLSTNSAVGGHVFALPVSGQAPRGAWRLDVVADPAQGPLSSQTILVEDFLPDRIEFDLSLPDASLGLGDTPPMQIDARYLFGAPASDLSVEGEARLRMTRNLDAYPDFVFGRYDQRFDTRTTYLDAVRTDAAGAARIALRMPKLEEMPSQPLEVAIVARIAEGSGRAVERRMTRALRPDGPLIGIKQKFEGVLAEGTDAVFDLIATQDELPVRWTFNRIETRYQWYQSGGGWAWEPLTRRIRVASGETDLGNTPTSLTLPTEWGKYELLVEHAGAAYAVSSVLISSGWYGGDSANDTPNFLPVSLDRETYRIGDTAQLRIVAPHAGIADISVMSNRVIEQTALAVEAGDVTIPLNVTQEWGNSAYVTATVIRPMDEDAGLNPARSLGLAHARIAPEDKQLTVSFDVPDVIDGQAGVLRVPVNISGIAQGETAYVTLAAVDVGILNLTNFKAPDPAAHYFGQRRLGVELRDVYGRLIDGLNGALGRVRSGGDAVAAAQLQSPPPTEALMAFYSGPVTVGSDGQAVVEVTRPAFNGTIRLMAIAWSETAVGSASNDIIARDPVVITASLPRLLAPDDQSQLLLELTPTHGTGGVASLEVSAGDGIRIMGLPTEVNLSQGVTLRLPFPLVAREIGDHQIIVKLTPSQGAVLQKVLTLAVRANDPEIATTRRFALGAGETFTFDRAVLGGLRQGTGSAVLTAGPLARLDVPDLLRQLDRYPYGCTEQVTSGALPLLYLSEIAGQAGLGAPDLIKAKVEEGIARVISRQASNGAFGMWRAQSGDFWLDAYVTDFLWRAQAQGYAVPQRALAAAMDNLRNRINFAPDFDRGGEDIAYALLVLARAGAAQMGDLRYYADTKAAAFATPMAVAQLGAALAAYGDPVRADLMFARAGALLLQAPDRTAWRDDFGSALRDRAAVLTLASESGSSAVDTVALARTLQSPERNLSTQEAAQVVLAAHAMGDSISAGITVDGAQVSGTLVRKLNDRSSIPMLLKNTSDTVQDITLTTYGVPQVAPDAGGYGYAITRQYFTMEGQAVTGPVVSGTRLVAVLSIQPFEQMGARLMIDDPLPGGFEIDNPNLLASGSVKGLDWLKTTTPQNVEFRSDRFLAAVDHSGAEAFQLAYVVRAVTSGSYHHPAALVSDMYRPEYRATTATSRLTVIP
ncbi:alpha-2-macroglobulin family protein [uncultured Sulfitobacter sp.]|uniref:alpha-2-macroglobulin family protein n=1 Tax=uncultured Sulfitobacter sp. TaxID=191468 RepID=UPI002623C5A0|nr:alpha-2-macroglobulin family protein [uncultured Sulfitobacter sp.]